MSKNVPKISIIVPIYNNEKHILRTLENIVEQSFKDFELILIDDGSTDSSKKLAEYFLSRLSLNYKIVSQNHNGASVARNLGLGLAEGKYVYFLDADDTITKNCLEEFFSLMENSDLDLALCAYNKIWEKSKEFWHYSDESMLLKDIKKGKEILQHVVKRRLYFLTGTVVIERSLIEKNKLLFTPGVTNGEDTEFFTKAIFNSKRIGFINKELFTHYCYQKSTSQKPTMKQFHAIGSLRRLLKYLKKKGASANILYYLEKRRIPQTYIQIMKKFAKKGINYNEFMKLAKKEALLDRIRKFKKVENSLKDKKTALEVSFFLYFPSLFYIYYRFKPNIKP